MAHIMSSCCQYREHVSCVDRLFPCGKAPKYWSINWSAAIVHLVNAVAMLLLWNGSENRDSVYRLTETYAPWVPPVNGTCAPGGIRISEDWCLERRTVPTAELSLWWLIIGFHGLSFVFQTLAMGECRALGKQKYTVEVEEQGTNTLRMLEYSVSATLMQLAIALLLGVWQRLVIIGIAFLTAATMLMGLVAEQSRLADLRTAWVAHGTGWFTMGGVWLILGRQLEFTLAKSPNGPPAFVYAIIVVIALLYSVFGFIQTYQLCKTNKGDVRALNETVEVAYCINSLVSKTFLGWMIFSNALVGVARS